MRRSVGTEGNALLLGARRMPIEKFDDIRIAAVGKAADAMMRGMLAVLASVGRESSDVRGLVVSGNRLIGTALPASITRRVGGHPLPTLASFEAGAELLQLVRGCTDRSLLVVLLSGGGSAMVESTVDDAIGPDELARVTEGLIRADVDIRAINAVRKRLSAIKGGPAATRGRASDGHHVDRLGRCAGRRAVRRVGPDAAGRDDAPGRARRNRSTSCGHSPCVDGYAARASLRWPRACLRDRARLGDGGPSRVRCRRVARRRRDESRFGRRSARRGRGGSSRATRRRSALRREHARSFRRAR